MKLAPFLQLLRPFLFKLRIVKDRPRSDVNGADSKEMLGLYSDNVKPKKSAGPADKLTRQST
jgi:hypothetical protein